MHNVSPSRIKTVKTASRMSKTRLTAARHTKPLPLLPGPVPTNPHIAQLLTAEAAFTVCVAEIDPMKGFNVALGFQKCDDMIRLCGLALRAARDSRVDFVGHINGNRFVLLLQSGDWRERPDGHSPISSASWRFASPVRHWSMVDLSGRGTAAALSIVQPQTRHWRGTDCVYTM